jgi:Na+-driven multidrug efflux pump
MGVRGNAIGSVLALVLGFIIYIIAISKEDIFKLKYKTNFRTIKEIVKASLPLMGQEVLEATVVVIGINSILSRVGIVEVSVYNLLLSIVGISLMPMYSYSQTSLTMISESIGAGDKKEIEKTPKTCLWLAVAIYLFVSFIIMIFMGSLAKFITSDETLINAAINYLPVAISISIFYIPATVYKYTLQGMGAEGWVFVASTIVNLIGIGLIFVLASIVKLGLNGIYIGLGMNYVLLICTYYYKYIGQLRDNDL